MIPVPTGFKIVSEEGNQGTYEVEGLYPGYGHTIGNAMRRVLLSSLRGAAITAVKIKNAPHEFTALDGVMEDLVEMSLNLKQVRFKMNGEESCQATISITGEKDVMAADIKTSGECEVVNGDLHIATLTSKSSKLEIDIEVSSGFGYQTVESRKKEKVDIGAIALDAAFSPVRRVNFEVENMRVGDRTDYNKVIFLVETDGSIRPQDALMSAAKILTEQFSALSGVTQHQETGAVIEANLRSGVFNGESEDVSYEERAGRVSIQELKLSNRTLNAITKSGFTVVGDLASRTEEEIRDGVRGLGDKGVVEIKKSLGNLGLTFSTRGESVSDEER
ncbi:MAG: DNA-directed RNA polymerase subunit alpha [Patescibacteria group bacterium]